MGGQNVKKEDKEDKSPKRRTSSQKEDTCDPWMERDMVTKLGGLENWLAKELATSQSREAISRAVAKGVT